LPKITRRHKFTAQDAAVMDKQILAQLAEWEAQRLRKNFRLMKAKEQYSFRK